MVPTPNLVMPSADPEITPPTVKVPAPVTVICRVPPKVTFPVPMCRLLVATTAKLLVQLCALLVVTVMSAPEVLPMVALLPLLMVKVPVPRAWLWLMFRREPVLPPLRVTPPVAPTGPAIVQVLAPVLVRVVKAKGRPPSSWPLPEPWRVTLLVAVPLLVKLLVNLKRPLPLFVSKTLVDVALKLKLMTRSVVSPEPVYLRVSVVWAPQPS